MKLFPKLILYKKARRLDFKLNFKLAVILLDEQALTDQKLHRMKNYLFLLIGLLLLGQLNPSQAQSERKSLLWEISGNGLKKSSYLFGTYHLVNNGLLDHYPSVNNALRKSKTVVVETVIDSSELAALSLLMLAPDGPTWTNALTADEKSQLDKSLKQYVGPGLEQLAVLKPSALSATLAMMATKAALRDTLKMYEGEPMDVWIAKQGKKKRKSLVALESLREQFELLYAKDSMSDQITQLQALITQIDSLDYFTSELYFAYLAQDHQAMQAIAQKHADHMGSMQTLLDDRNQRWMEKLPQLMAQNKTFIAVGALHLGGEKGLIELLRKAGYTVKPIRNRYEKHPGGDGGASVVLLLLLPVLMGDMKYMSNKKPDEPISA